MPLPDALTTTVLSGTYTAPDGTPLGGYLTFTPSSALTNGSGHPVLAATQLTARLQPGTGAFSISLLNTDNDGLLPDTWMWHVAVSVPGAQESYFFGLPSTLGDATDINTLTPVSPPPSGASFVASINGQTGDVVLADGFGILPPAGDLGGGTTLAPHVTATHLADPLPVVQGGTGAATGAAALTALGGISSASPALTGTPTAPTASALTSTTQIATTAYADSAVGVEAARAATAEGLKLAKASNLSDLASTSTARTNLGLGTAATLASSAVAQTANNLSDLANAATARGNLGAQGVRTPTAVKTGTSYTAVAGDFAKIDSTAGAYTVTLPAAPADKTVIGVKLVASAAAVNPVTITRGGSDTFNVSGGTTLTLKLLNQGVLLQYDTAATAWDVHSDDLPLGGLDGRYAPVPVLATADTTGAKDAAAIAAAITAAASSGGFVQLGAGTFWLNAGLTVPAGVFVVGMGAGLTTVKVANGASSVIPFLIQNVSNAGVRDLTVDLNKANTTNGASVSGQMGVYVNAGSASMTGIDIRRVTVINGWQIGVSVVAFPLTLSIGGILEDVTVTGCGNTGINLSGVQSVMLVRPNVSSCGASGVFFGSSSAFQVIDAVSNFNASHGLTCNAACNDFKIHGGHFTGSTAGYGIAVSIACVNFTITGPTCQSNDLGGISIDVANSAGLVTGTATSGSVTTLADTSKTWTVNQWAGYTVRLTGGTGSGESAVITSNTSNTLTFPAVVTAPDATSTYSIDGNHIFYPVGATVSGAVCSGNTGQGIWVDYCSGLTITGCAIHHNGGIGVDLVAQYCLVTGNDIHDNTGRAVLINQGSDPMGGHRVTGNSYRNNQSGVNVSAAATSIPNIIDEYVNLGQTATLITATNSAWPIPSGANWLEITAAAGGAQGGGGGSLGQPTLTTALTSSVAVTSLAVTALPQAVKISDTITVTSGSNTQAFTASAAASLGATSVSVTSLAANFSYPIGSTATDTGGSGAWTQAGAGAGACGAVSTQVVAVGANTTLNVTVGAGGSATGAGGAVGGNAGSAGANGTSTTVTGTGISVTGSRGQGGGPSAASSVTAGFGGLYGTATQGTIIVASGGGLGGTAGGFPAAGAAGGGGGGQAATAVTGGAGGGAGTAAAAGAAGTGGSGSATGGNGAAAGANTGAGGGGGGGGAPGGAGGTGGAGGSGYVIVRVVG